MSAVVVQSITPQTLNGGDTLDISFGSPVTPGNTVIVELSIYNSTDSTLAVSDNQGNGAYSALTTATASNDQARAAQFYKENVAASGTFTITINPALGSGNYIVASALEVSGLETSSVLRDSGNNQAANTATDASVATAGSAAVAGDFVVANVLVAIDSSSNVNLGAAATTGYTNIGVFQNYTSINSFSGDYKVAGAGGSQTANWSHDSTAGLASNGWAAVIGVYKTAGGGGGTSIPVIQHHRLRH